MKNLITIGGGVILLVLLLSAKKENQTPPIVGPIELPQIDIFVPESPVLPVETARSNSQLNHSLSPDLTDYKVSDFDRLVNALGNGN